MVGIERSGHYRGEVWRGLLSIWVTKKFLMRRVDNRSQSDFERRMKVN